jgi:4-amino-4-deoxy-L-arabinose transferase-like glycosyltransferase
MRLPSAFSPGPKATVLLHSIAILALAVLFSFRVIQTLDSKPPSSDAVAYMAMAYNLVNHGILSEDKDRTSLTPTAYRAPGFPLFVASAILITGENQGEDLAAFLMQNFTGVKLLLEVVILITGLLAAFLVWRMTRSTIGAYIAFFGIACVGTLHRLAAILYAEPLAAMLVLMLAASLYYAVETRRISWFLAVGVLAGTLALTRTAFFYIPPIMVALFIYVWLASRNHRSLLTGGVVAFLMFAIITGGWMVRNHHHFDRAFISERGGLALIHRVEYNKMTKTEFFASFCVYSNCWPLTALLQRFDREDYHRLLWQEPDSYYHAARAQREDARKVFATSLEEDNALKSKGLREIFVNAPLKHLLVTIPIAHRSLYVHSCLFTIIAVIGSLYLLIVSLRRKQPQYVALLFPLVFGFAMTSFLSMGIPRFNMPLVPILWIATGISAAELLAKFQARNGSGAHLRTDA